MRSRMSVFAALALAIPTGLQSADAEGANYTVKADVQYCTGGGRPLTMDLYIPNARPGASTPAVVWIHGGGWEAPDGPRGKSSTAALAQAGFVTAFIHYRLSDEAKFPANIEDSKCAIRYLRANAGKYGIDPNRIGVAGESAGGHLSLLVATADAKAGLEGNGGWAGVSSRVSAVVVFYPATDLRNMTATFVNPLARRVIPKMIGGSEADKASAYARASPVRYVSGDDPPLLVFAGAQDGLVPVSQSERMVAAYKAAGAPGQFVKVENSDHGFAPARGLPPSPSYERITAMMVAFFRQRLGLH